MLCLVQEILNGFECYSSGVTIGLDCEGLDRGWAMVCVTYETADTTVKYKSKRRGWQKEMIMDRLCDV